MKRKLSTILAILMIFTLLTGSLSTSYAMETNGTEAESLSAEESPKDSLDTSAKEAESQKESLDTSAKEEIKAESPKETPQKTVTGVSKAPATSTNVYYKIENGVLHLGNTSYAGDNSDLVPATISDSTQPWKAQRNSITSVAVDSDIYPTNTAYWFYDLNKCTSMDLAKLHTENVTDMSYMFSYCSSLTELDVSNFDTSKVTGMSYMFYNCSSLTELDVSNFDTSKVTRMDMMFSGCNSLTELNISSFDTLRVTDMKYMFNNCSSLTELDVSNFNTSNVTDMSYMFYNCSSLTELDVSNFDTSNVVNMKSMFNGCSSLTELDVSNFDTSKVTNMSYMFMSCNSLINLDLSSFDTSKVTNMRSMFWLCSKLTALNVSNFDTSKVTDMSYMFYNCSSLTELDVSNFDTSKVTNMSYMFSDCNKLKKLITQKKGKKNIELPFEMIEENSVDGLVYKVMPSGSKTLVPFELGFLENVTDTMLYYRKTLNDNASNLNTYNFGIYKEDGTLVSTVQNDASGNILVETKDLPLGRYYIQEVAGSEEGMYYDPVKYYFSIEEKITQTSGTVIGAGDNFLVPLDTSIFTNPENRLVVSAFNVTVYDKNDNVLYSGRSYCANRAKRCAHGELNRIYVNPTLDEINTARGEVYAGGQTDLADAVRCILWFERDTAQSRIWDLFNGGQIIDTSRKNEIPDWFSWAIITPPDWSMQPQIIPLATSKEEVTETDTTTGIIKTRLLKKEGGADIRNTTDVPTSIQINKKDDFQNEVVGATLAIYNELGGEVDRWVSDGQPHTFTAPDGTYTLKEIEVPEGYFKAEDIAFAIRDGKVYVTKNGKEVETQNITMVDEKAPTLTFSKNVSGKNLTNEDLNKLFDFKVLVKPNENLPEGTTVDGVILRNGTKITLTVGTESIVSLAHSNTAELFLPVGTEVRIEEVKTDGFVSTIKDINSRTELIGNVWEGEASLSGSSVPTRVTFNNKKSTKLEITKRVTGSLGERDRQFEFLLEIEEKAILRAPTKRTGEITNEEISVGTMNFSGVITRKDGSKENVTVTPLFPFTLADGETLTVELPNENYTYTVRETQVEGYETSVAVKKETDANPFYINDEPFYINNEITSDETVMFTNNKDFTETPTGINITLSAFIFLILTGLVLITAKKITQ